MYIEVDNCNTKNSKQNNDIKTNIITDIPKDKIEMKEKDKEKNNS